MRQGALAAALMLLLASCALGSGPPATSASFGASTTRPPATTTTTTMPVPTVPPYEARPCPSAPPLGWAPLCRGFDLVQDRYVDEIDPASLAAAAGLGVSRAATTPASIGRGSRVCYLPHPAFASTCEAMVERAGPDGDPVALVDAAVDGLFRHGLDAFSWYLPGDLAGRLGTGEAGFVASMGLVVAALDPSGDPCGPIGPGCSLTVVSVFGRTTGEQAAISAGDLIAAVDGTLVDGLTLAEATLLLEGQGTGTARLGLLRGGTRVDRSVGRELFLFEPVETAALGNGTVYLRVNEFSVESAQLVGAALGGDGPSTAASAIVLDLRDNPGGLVVAAQAIASQFLDGGVVMVEQARDGALSVPVLPGGYARDPAVKVVVLVNRGSASAAEIVAAVLQERGRAVVVGETTFGKDLVQQTFDLGRDAEVHLTVARWLTPEGRSVAPGGLRPDVAVAGGGDGDPILARALELLSG